MPEPPAAVVAPFPITLEALEALPEIMSLDLLFQNYFTADKLRSELGSRMENVVKQKLGGDWSKVSELEGEEKVLYQEYQRAGRVYTTLYQSVEAAESSIVKSLLQITDNDIRNGDLGYAVYEVGRNIRELHRSKREKTSLDQSRNQLRASIEVIQRRMRNAYTNYQPFSSEESARRLEELPAETLQVKKSGGVEGEIVPIRQSVNLEQRAAIYREINNASKTHNFLVSRYDDELARDLTVLLDDIRHKPNSKGKNLPALENLAVTFEGGKMILTTHVKEMVGLFEKSEIVVPLRIVVVNSDQPPGIAIEPIDLSHLDNKLRLAIQLARRNELNSISAFPTQLIEILNAKLFEGKVTGFHISTDSKEAKYHCLEIKGVNKKQ